MRKVKSASLMISVLMVLSIVSIAAVAPVSAAEAGTIELDKDWYTVPDEVKVTVNDPDYATLIEEEREILGIGDGTNITFTVLTPPIADVNGDGKVDSDDITVYDDFAVVTVYSVEADTGKIALAAAPGAATELLAATDASTSPLTLTKEPSEATRLQLVLGADTVAGDIVISGTDRNDTAIEETVHHTGGKNTICTENFFKTVGADNINASGIAYDGAGDTIAVYEVETILVDYTHGVIDHVDITAASTGDTENITVTLTETGPGTGILKGTFNLGLHADDTLLAADGDTITVTYEDSGPSDWVDTDTAKVDTVKPTIEVLTPAEFTNDNTPTISAVLADENSGIDNNTIVLKVDGTLIPADNYTYEPSTGLLSFTPGPGMAIKSLEEGECVVNLDVSDIAGNGNAATWTFTVDITSPEAPATLDAKAFPHRIDLDWPEVTDPISGDVASGIAYYNIYSSDVETTEPKDIVALDNFVDNVASTETAYMDTGLLDGTTYYYAVTAVDVAGNEGDPSPVASATFFQAYPTTPYEVSLVGGWNLVSLPLIPENDAIENVISGVKGSVESVWAYDAVEEKWCAYSTADVPEWASDLAKMEDGKGYWMYMSEPAILEGEGYEMIPGAQIPPAYNVVSGWNLIGFKTIDVDLSEKVDSNDIMEASYYLRTVTEGWTYLRMWSTATVKFVEIAPTTDMIPGHGYWIYMDVSGQIVPPIEPPK